MIEVARSAVARWRRGRAYAWHLRRHAVHAGGPRLVATGPRHSNCATPGPTFAMVCGGHFDSTVPNAATTCRVGWCNGFESLGVRTAMVSALSLERELAQFADPFCWIAASDYAYLARAQRAALARVPHAVLVDPWFRGEQSYWAAHHYPMLHNPAWLRARVLSTQPRFLFTISPESTLDRYEGWASCGLPVHSLPLACDTHHYPAGLGGDEYEEQSRAQEMVFVGGYWPYKALQFDRYLKPHSDRLRVFGYSRWPYGHYGGQLAREQEAALYAGARVSPVINEPHASAMGIDLNERVFKVMGSGGLAVTDVSPAYRDWFDSDELLVPGSIAEYRDIVELAMRSPAQFAQYRLRGRRAVLERHTYQHRARKFAALMSVDVPVLR